MSRLALVVPLLLSAACGPFEYLSVSTFQASRAVSQARAARAAVAAPYELTAAEEYLHKSRELAGFSRWQQSIGFARKARDFAQQAYRLAAASTPPPAPAAPAARPDAPVLVPHGGPVERP
jgi:hypothetical protein